MPDMNERKKTTRTPGPSRWTRLPKPPPEAPSRSGQGWSERDDELLQKHYGTHGSAYTAALLGRTRNAVQHRALRLGLDGYETRSWRRKPGEVDMLERTVQEVVRTRPLHRPTLLRGTYVKVAARLKRTRGSVAGKRWGQKKSLYRKSIVAPDWRNDEERYLRRHYGKMPTEEIARALGRSPTAIHSRSRLLGLKHRKPPRPWSAEDDWRLTELHDRGWTPRRIAAELGRMKIEIVRRSNELGIYRSMRHWTKREDALLRRLYGTEPYETIARRLGRSVTSVTGRVAQLGIATPRAKNWSPEEILFLQESYGTFPAEEIARTLGRSENAVWQRASQFGLTVNIAKEWTPQEEARLRDLYGTMGYEALAKELGRTRDSVEGAIRRLGLSRESPMRKRWTPEEDEELRRLHGTITARKLGEKLGRTREAIIQRAGLLGLGDKPSRPWTEEEDDLMRRHYGTMPRPKLAELLDRTIPSIAARADMLGLSKPKRKKGEDSGNAPEETGG